VPSDGDFADTNQQEVARYKALIYELISLELLSKHPNVIDLLGITWEIENEQVWPVLLTERSMYGTMADFLPSELGVKLDSWEKLGLCADVARACQALHTMGEITSTSPNWTQEVLTDLTVRNHSWRHKAGKCPHLLK
jgi:hypothetical protein